jgi:hypothetical protein
VPHGTTGSDKTHGHLAQGAECAVLDPPRRIGPGQSPRAVLVRPASVGFSDAYGAPRRNALSWGRCLAVLSRPATDATHQARLACKAAMLIRRSFQTMGESTDDGVGSEVFDQLLAGETPAHEITSKLRRLPDENRQRLLCMLCAYQVELGSTCPARAEDVERFFNSECPFHRDGKKNCLR